VARDEPTSAFAGEPQPVEVFHRGVWYPGELLGWRHEDDGRCRARVRCVVDGLRHTAWMDLIDLRLPLPAAAQAPAAPAPARPPVAQPAPGRHRALDDETQPHVLLAVRPSRPRPPAVLPPPRSHPAPHDGEGRLSPDGRPAAGRAR
jgi:hypothetical protein